MGSETLLLLPQGSFWATKINAFLLSGSLLGDCSPIVSGFLSKNSNFPLSPSMLILKLPPPFLTNILKTVSQPPEYLALLVWATLLSLGLCDSSRILLLVLFP